MMMGWYWRMGAPEFFPGLLLFYGFANDEILWLTTLQNGVRFRHQCLH
jgi:hypothetical protein